MANGSGLMLSNGVAPIPYVAAGRTGGHYSVGFLSGTVAGAVTAGATGQVVSIRWQHTDLKFIPLRISLDVLCSAFSTGVSLDFAAYVARNFTASASGGTAITAPSKTSSVGMNGSIFTSNGDFRVATTTNLTAGTHSLDTNPIGTAWAPFTAVEQAVKFDLYTVTDFGQHPVVLNNNEGIVIRLETVNLSSSNSIKIRGRIEWVETALQTL